MNKTFPELQKFIGLNYNVCEGDINSIAADHGCSVSLLFDDGIDNIDVEDDRLNVIIEMSTGFIKGFKVG